MTYTFTKDGDTWTYDGDTSLDMDEEAIDSHAFNTVIADSNRRDQ